MLTQKDLKLAYLDTSLTKLQKPWGDTHTSHIDVCCLYHHLKLRDPSVTTHTPVTNPYPTNLLVHRHGQISGRHTQRRSGIQADLQLRCKHHFSQDRLAPHVQMYAPRQRGNKSPRVVCRFYDCTQEPVTIRFHGWNPLQIYCSA